MTAGQFFQIAACALGLPAAALSVWCARNGHERHAMMNAATAAANLGVFIIARSWTWT
jgi:hypothetical protein